MDPEQLQSQMENARRKELALNKFEGVIQALEDAEQWKEVSEMRKLMMQEERKTNADLLRKSIEKAKAEERKMIQEVNADLLRKSIEKAKVEEREMIQEVNADLLRKSIEKVYLSGKDGSLWSCPPLELNKNVKPSLEGHSLKSMGKQPATYDKNGSCNEDIWDKLETEGFVVVRAVRDGKKLGSEFDPATTIKYKNEIDIQVHFRMQVIDAIRVLNGTQHLETSMELSLFGISPDILVITRGGKMVFVIEIKSPNREGTQDNVCENGWVGGQIWLYLMLMKASGIDNPIGAICTFNEFRIVSLKDMNSHRFLDSSEMLRNNDLKNWGVVSEEPKQQGIPSPNQKLAKACEMKNEHIPSDPTKLFPNHEFETTADDVIVFKNAVLCSSKILKDALVFPALVLSLLTALIENDVIRDAPDANEKKTLPEVSFGDQLGRRLYAWADEQVITMGFTKKDLVVKNGRATANSFHLLGKLGEGHESEVYLGLTSSGMPVSIKFRKFEESRVSTVEDRMEEDTSTLKKLERDCDLELDRWQALYKDRHTRKVKLAKRACLQMEYGKPLSDDKREDHAVEIVQELLRFFILGFMHAQRDLRWHHVMMDLFGKLFLTDLRSLEELPKEHRKRIPMVVQKDAKTGRLFIVEKTRLDEKDEVAIVMRDALEKSIESFLGRGYQMSTMETEHTNDAFASGTASTAGSRQDKQREHEYRDETSLSTPAPAKKAKQQDSENCPPLKK
eukprot:CAMPEP_0113465574 /NCGR_PEP_ID=MMETSP0014_2-20120614/13812_1 /TAXON_ID=2857 /ORGANISM="Nitzschia sp." /LENGTH=733 /DNA_ID=CAMNT_0000357741 /DNA_START=242 /DNA_END=2443 /DNA_ORIENTATION=- /assembly_acc=CAM_ASM_000159